MVSGETQMVESDKFRCCILAPPTGIYRLVIYWLQPLEVYYSAMSTC
jgi:hypothetical protein